MKTTLLIAASAALLLLTGCRIEGFYEQRDGSKFGAGVSFDAKDVQSLRNRFSGGGK